MEMSYEEKLRACREECKKSCDKLFIAEDRVPIHDFERSANEVKKIAEEMSLKDMKMSSFITCRKCGCKEIFSYDKQTRSADEGATRFFECTNSKCGFRWRN